VDTDMGIYIDYRIFGNVRMFMDMDTDTDMDI
jgi:hypothetical protein